MTACRKNHIRIILILLIALTVLFIWSNSAKDAAASTEDSDTVIDLIKPVVDPDDSINRNSFELFVRKAAHFLEFALLGCEICLLVSTFCKKRIAVPISVGGTLLGATVDELIQLGSPGRAALPTDVILDTLGGLFGALVALLLLLAVKKIRSAKKSKS